MIPGGAFAAWWDGNGQLFAQRIKAGLAWGAQGVLVGKHDTTGGLDLIRDGESGLIVAWSGSDTTPQRTQIRTQRLDGNGKSQWTKNGALVLDSTVVGGNWPSAGTSISIASDGAAGLVIAWLDSRAADVDLYAQRVDSTGKIQWVAGGVLLPPYILSQVAPGAQGTPRIVPDLKGGVIVTYQDKGQFSWDIAATRLNAKGNKLFSKWIRSDSLSRSKPGLDQREPDIAYDASGPKLNGAIIVWTEREKPYRRLYVQKIKID